MNAITHWIDAWINVMLGMCIGIGMTVVFAAGAWLVTWLLISSFKMWRVHGLPADPKHVYPPYVKGADHESK